jgi:hypothetical protein
MSGSYASQSRRGALVAFVGGAAMLAAIACSDSTGNGATAALQLSFFAPSTGTASVANLVADPAFTVITGGGHTVDLTSAAINLSAVEVHTSTGVEIENETECEHAVACDRVVGSPLTVTLSPNGSTVTLTTATIPEGTFREIELKVASIRLVGTFDGAAFDLVVPLNVKLKQEFSPPVQVGGTASASNLTVNVPVLTWLKNPDGTLIDPRQLATNATLRATLLARIQASLKAFRDDDHNGGDDDHGNTHG